MSLSPIEKRNVESVLVGLEGYNMLGKALYAESMERNPAAGFGATGPGEKSQAILEQFLATITPDMKWASMNGNLIQGKDAIVRDLIASFETLPENRAVIPPEVVVAQDDMVILRYALVGQETRGFMGFPPIRRPYSVMIDAFNRFTEDGLRSEAIFGWNPLNLYFQLGFEHFEVLQGAKYPVSPFSDASMNRIDEAVAAGLPGAGMNLRGNMSLHPAESSGLLRLLTAPLRISATLMRSIFDEIGPMLASPQDPWR